MKGMEICPHGNRYILSMVLPSLSAMLLASWPYLNSKDSLRALGLIKELTSQQRKSSTGFMLIELFGLPEHLITQKQLAYLKGKMAC